MNGPAVGEHGRPPQFGATFGARALQLYSNSPQGAPPPVIPDKLALLDTPMPGMPPRR